MVAPVSAAWLVVIVLGSLNVAQFIVGVRLMHDLRRERGEF